MFKNKKEKQTNFEQLKIALSKYRDKIVKVSEQLDKLVEKEQALYGIWRYTDNLSIDMKLLHEHLQTLKELDKKSYTKATKIIDINSTDLKVMKKISNDLGTKRTKILNLQKKNLEETHSVVLNHQKLKRERQILLELLE